MMVCLTAATCLEVGIIGAGIGGVRAALAWRGRGAVEEERRGDRRNKITHEEGGEATGAFATRKRKLCPNVLS